MSKCTPPHPPYPSYLLNQTLRATDSKITTISANFQSFLGASLKGNEGSLRRKEPLDGEGHHPPPQLVNSSSPCTRTEVKGRCPRVPSPLQPNSKASLHPRPALYHHTENNGSNFIMWNSPPVLLENLYGLDQRILHQSLYKRTFFAFLIKPNDWQRRTNSLPGYPMWTSSTPTKPSVEFLKNKNLAQYDNNA